MAIHTSLFILCYSVLTLSGHFLFILFEMRFIKHCDAFKSLPVVHDWNMHLQINLPGTTSLSITGSLEIKSMFLIFAMVSVAMIELIIFVGTMSFTN